MQVADYLISSGRCASIRHLSGNVRARYAYSGGIVLHAVQRLGIADPRLQQMEAIKTFMQGKYVFVSLPTG